MQIQDMIECLRWKSSLIVTKLTLRKRGDLSKDFLKQLKSQVEFEMIRRSEAQVNKALADLWGVVNEEKKSMSKKTEVGCYYHSCKNNSAHQPNLIAGFCTRGQVVFAEPVRRTGIPGMIGCRMYKKFEAPPKFSVGDIVAVRESVRAKLGTAGHFNVDSGPGKIQRILNETSPEPTEYKIQALDESDPYIYSIWPEKSIEAACQHSFKCTQCGKSVQK